jgi:hypothetical protein
LSIVVTSLFGVKTDRMTLRRRATSMAITAALIGVGAAGCGFPDRHRVAEAIEEHLRSMPGVVSAERNYDTSFDGGAHYYQDVEIAPNATAAQASAVAHYFAERVAASDFASFDVTLTLTHNRFGSKPLGGPSTFELRYGFSQPPVVPDSTSVPIVTHDVDVWMQASLNSQVSSVRWDLPDHPYTKTPSPTVGIAVDADDAALKSLRDRLPQLGGATWQVILPSPYRPVRYTSLGRLPSAANRQAWQRIVAGLPNRSDASAETRSQTPAGQPVTTVTISMIGFETNEELSRAAYAAAEQVKNLPLPARLIFGDPTVQDDGGKPLPLPIDLVVGGCSGPPDRSRPAGKSEEFASIQAALRRNYETC